MEDKKEGGFTDMFFIDEADLGKSEESETVVESGSGGVEDTTEEIIEEGESGVEDVQEEINPEPTATDDSGDNESENGDEKQAEGSEVEQEDASLEDSNSGNEFETVIESLVNDNILDFDDEKEYEMTASGLKELIEENKNKAYDSAIDKFKSNLDDEGQVILDTLASGGSIEDYLNSKNKVDYSSIPIIYSDGTPIEENQEKLLYDLFKEEGYSDDVIESRLTNFKRAGIMEQESTIAKGRLQAIQESKEKRFAEERREKYEEQVANDLAMAKEFEDMVKSTKEISGFKIKESDASELFDFITKPVGKDGQTAFDMADNDENRMLYAYFAMKGFDKSALSREIATEQSRSLRKKLSNHSDSRSNMKGSNSRTKIGNDKVDIPWNMT